MLSFLGYGCGSTNNESKAFGKMKVDDLLNYTLYKGGHYSEPNVEQQEQAIDVFSTALDIGKYSLSLLILQTIKDKVAKETGDYLELKKDFYIFYMVNEFLEHPEIYSSMENPIASPLCDRNGKESLEAELKNKNARCFSKLEVLRLFRLFKKKITLKQEKEVNLKELPDFLKTGSGYYGRYSSLHSIIKSLSNQCEEVLYPPQESKKEPV